MDTACAAVLLALLGVNFGWQPVDDGPAGYEYVVQIEPELVDVLGRGESLPIESYVPAEVAPIRKVTIVVGRGEVERVPLAADAEALQKYVVAKAEADATEPVVRGQNDWSNSGWVSDRYNTPGQGQDRYGQAPSVLERAHNAVVETGTALRDGVGAGVQAANQQLSHTGEQVIDATRSVGQGLRSATEQTLGVVTAPLQQGSRTHAPATPGGLQQSPPYAAVARPHSPPPLLNPPLLPLSTYPVYPPAAVASNTGPGFPVNTPNMTTVQSVPVRETPSAAGAGDDLGLAPLRPLGPPLRQPEQQEIERWSDPFDDPRWNQPPQSEPIAQQQRVESPVSRVESQQPAAESQPPVVSQPTPAPSLEPQPPWLPLLVVSLALAGSFGANLFLGWSYMDARQKYRSLVRKTASRFGRDRDVAA